MKPIVVPVSFSNNSNNAARYATDLALAIGAEVRLLYSFQVPVSLSEVPMPESAFEDLQGSGMEMLEKLRSELLMRTAGKVPVSVRQKIGTVEGAIEDFCEESDPILVVMGATGGGLENALTGSSTIRAVRRLPFPLLIIPEGVIYHQIHRVVLACNPDDLWSGLPVNSSVMQWLSSLPEVQLDVVHVITHEESGSEFSQTYNQWKLTLKGLSPQLFFVRATNVAEGLNLHLKTSPADLLLVFPKQHNLLEFHRSQAKRLVLHCPLPVLSIHE